MGDNQMAMNSMPSMRQPRIYSDEIQLLKMSTGDTRLCVFGELLLCVFSQADCLSLLSSYVIMKARK